MKNRLTAFALLTSMALGFSSVSCGHEIFQDVMKEKYILKSFSCKTCHPDNDDRKIRSMFAELIYQELKDLNLTEKYAAVEPQGKEAITAFEQSIVEDFKKAMDVVGKKQLTIDQMFKEGLFYGARLDEKKIEEMKAAGEQ